MNENGRRRLADRVALITGGGSGIGAAITRQFAQEGANVAICGRRPALLEEVARRVATNGAPVLCVPGDVATDAGAIIQAVIDRYGRLDVLVNNAATSTGMDVLEMSRDDWQRVMAVNLDGVFNMVHAALPHLMAAKGNVLHISSISAVSGEFDDVAYAASKAGLEGFSRKLALELATAGVRSNVIRPGLIVTEAFAEMPDEFFQSQIPLIPLGRVGQPQDIAMAAAYLCSEEANFVTGAVLTVDGGESAR